MSKNPHSAGRRVLSLAALSGLGLAAAPAAHAAALADTPLYPLAHTPVDVLSNNFRVPVGGLDLSTIPLTAPFRNGVPLREVPVAGELVPGT